MFLRRSQPGAGCLSAVLLHGSFHLLNTYCTSATGLSTGVALREPSSQYPCPISFRKAHLQRSRATEWQPKVLRTGEMSSPAFPLLLGGSNSKAHRFPRTAGHAPKTALAKPCKRMQKANPGFTSFFKTEYLNPISQASPRIKQKLDFLTALISRSYLPVLCPCSPDAQGQPRTVGETLSQN